MSRSKSHFTALEARKLAKKVQATVRAKKANEKLKTRLSASGLHTITEEQKRVHINFIQEQIKKAAESGQTSCQVHYAAVDPDNGELIFSLAFFKAIARAFKDSFPNYMVITDTGPKRLLTIDWSGRNDV